MDLQNILKTYFGYDEFRNGQDKLIESIIKIIFLFMIIFLQKQ